MVVILRQTIIVYTRAITHEVVEDIVAPDDILHYIVNPY